TDSRQSVWIPPEFPITGRLPLEPRQVETNIKKQKKEAQYLPEIKPPSHYRFVRNNQSHNDLFHGVINNRSQ
ncbi:hypothetical protein ID855_21505, partial [Xenorhabdus sp. ZM]